MTHPSPAALVSEHPIHPHYGPCDALHPSGSCAACVEQFQALSARAEKLQEERDFMEQMSLAQQDRAKAAEQSLAALGERATGFLVRAEAAEQALAEREFQGTETAPKDGTPVCGLEMYRYMPYKPDGQRQMKKDGRWQRWNGYGWDNSEPPDGWLPASVKPSALQSTQNEVK